MISENEMPQVPTITQEQLEQARESEDYCPILFEWYKFVGEVSNFIARLSPDSPAFINIPPIHHAIFTGLLNRCSRLMLANINLSHKGLYGETTAIIDRCIFESCIKLIWLCNDNTEEKFQRYLADGLKAELRLKNKINTNIASRKENQLVIEKRMLESIERYVTSTKLTEEQVKSIKKLPSLWDMITEIENDDLTYIVGQKIGSHHVHGTWPSLYMHYITLDESGFYAPRDHDSATHVNQYIITSLFVLRALEAYIKFIVVENDTKDSFMLIIDGGRSEILKLNTEIVGNDFELLNI